jgi:hypothetical protein
MGMLPIGGLVLWGVARAAGLEPTTYGLEGRTAFLHFTANGRIPHQNAGT